MSMIAPQMDPPPDMIPTATGDLVRTPLAHVIVFVADRKLTGSLVLRGDDGSNSTVYLSSGAPSKVCTTYPGTYLGRVLLQLGYIDDEQLEASLEEMRRTGMLHGELLLATGLIDEAQLVAGLREQMMRRLLKVFEKVREFTTYSFYSSTNLLEDYGGSELTPVDPYRVMWEGMHLRPNDPSIDPTIARLGTSLIGINSQADFRRLGFGQQEHRVVEMLGLMPMTMAQVLDLNVMPIRQLKLLMYCLLITKGIVMVPAPTSANTANASGGKLSSAQVGSSVLTQDRQAVEAPQSSTRLGYRLSDDDPPASVPMARMRLKKAIAQKAQKAKIPSDPPISKRIFLDRARHIESEDYFQVLGIDRGATASEAQTAYFALAKQWHPDRIPPQFDEARDAAARVFTRMTDAYRTLTDPEKRAQYMVALEKGVEEFEEQAKVQRVIDATIEYQKAEVYLRRRDYSNALHAARKAYDGAPEEAHHIALYAWLLSQQPEALQNKDFEPSIALLSKAIELNARCEQAYLYRAMLLKQLGKASAALRDFRRVVELNPRNVDASREVRFATMRGGPKDGVEDRASLRPTARPSGKPSSSPGINWSKDSMTDIFEKLFKKKPNTRGKPKSFP